jgi:predicted ABC-type sugar transport system permease subunit
MLAAVFIGLGGILVASRNMSAQIQGAAGYAMPAISAPRQVAMPSAKALDTPTYLWK